MAHNISLNSAGTAEAVFGFGEKPWWDTAQMPAVVLDGPLSFNDVFTHAFTWEAIAQQLRYADGSLSSMQGFRRSDTGAELGVHSLDYGVVQPKMLFDFCAAFFQAYPHVPIASAIAMHGGAVLNISARVGEIDVLGSGDTLKTYLCFLNSYNGRYKATVYKTAVRPVCENTTVQGLKSSDFDMSYRHTKHVQANIQNDAGKAARLMADQQASDVALKEVLEKLAQKTMKPQGYVAMLGKIFGDQDTARTNNIKGKVLELVDYNDGGKWPDWKRTAYNLYNAITNYVDHEQLVQQTDKNAHMSKQQLRFERAQIGEGATFKEKALQHILVMADGSECCEDTPVYSMPPQNIAPTFEPWAGEIVVGPPVDTPQASALDTWVSMPAAPIAAPVPEVVPEVVPEHQVSRCVLYTTAVAACDLPGTQEVCIVECISESVHVRQVTVSTMPGQVSVQIDAYRAAGCLAATQAEWDQLQQYKRSAQ